MRRYRLPLLSGVLMALVFYPFYFWPLALIALAPLYYFAAGEGRSTKEVFWGGTLAGAVLSIPLYYFTLGSLVPGLGTELYTIIVRAAAVPATVFESLLFGLLALAWRSLRSRSPLLNALAGAACYVLLEEVITVLFQGYYPEALSAALVHMPVALPLAALGGTTLVSFAAAALSIAAAHAARVRRVRPLWGLAAALILTALAAAGQGSAPLSAKGTSLAVSIMQTVPTSLEGLRFGTMQQGAFVDPSLQQFFTDAAQGSNLVIYPFSPVEGTVSTAENAALGRWLAGFMPASTTVLLWDTNERKGSLIDEYNAWQGGVEQSYQKRMLYAFSDYTPAWARPLGLEKSPDTISPGAPLPPLSIDGVAAEGLICSELHNSTYARAQGARADFIIAAGYDAFFPGELMGDYSLTTARYAAAELGEPVVRANFFGPSAVINAGGSLEAWLPFGRQGIVRAPVVLQKKSTLYARLGSAPFWVFVCAMLLLALWCRTKSPYSAEK